MYQQESLENPILWPILPISNKFLQHNTLPLLTYFISRKLKVKTLESRITNSMIFQGKQKSFGYSLKGPETLQNEYIRKKLQ